MPILFSYGTLRQEHVQRSTFGRLLAGTPDEVAGFETAVVPIEDIAAVAASGQAHHANAVYTGRPDCRVRGIAFIVTDAELAVADEYERGARYRRTEVSLV